MKNFLIVFSWFAISFTTLLVSLWSYNLASAPKPTAVAELNPASFAAKQARQPHLAYASIPNSLTELKTAISAKDARPLVIENYLKRYNSPMSGNGNFIVKKAEELGKANSIDPTYLAFLTIAIGQNESNLGKRMPPDCHNAWGYGIHSAGTLCFANWEEGISRFMKGVAEDFIAKRGLETPEEIMTRYTPYSPNGAWAKGVNQFLTELYEGKKPNI